MAFPLAAIGAGLGQFAEQYQRERENQVRSLMLQMQLQKFQEEMADRQRERAGSAGVWSALSGGMGVGAPQSPIRGLPQPGGGVVDTTSGVTPAGAGGANPLSFVPMLADMAARGQASGETTRPGSAFEGQYSQSPQEARRRFAAAPAASGPNTGYGPAPVNTADLGVPGTPGLQLSGGPGFPSQIGASNSIPDTPPKTGGGSPLDRGFPSTMATPDQLVQQSPLQMAQAQAQAALPQVTQGLDPSVYGRMSTQALAARIEQAMPGADPLAKMLALERGQKLLAPDQQAQFQIWKMQHDQEFKALQQNMRQENINQRLEDKQMFAATLAEQRQRAAQALAELRQELSPGSLITTDKGMMRIRPGSNKAEAIDLGGAQPMTSAAAGRKAEQISVSDPETGKETFSGLAHEVGRGNWVDANNQPIDTAGKRIAAMPTSIGVQTQNVGNRISNASNEVARAVENMTKLPIGDTLGWFGGAQALTAQGLREGIQKSLANEVSPQSAQRLAAMARGVNRGLATLAATGAATGLVALQKSMEGEIPQQGDSAETILVKYANMRQVVEAANDTIQAASGIAETQKKQMQANTDRIIKAVPWTVNDVIAMSANPSDETVVDFAKKMGLGSRLKVWPFTADRPGEGGQQGAQPSAAPAVPESLRGIKLRGWSPSQQRFYDEGGKAYDKDGKPVQ